MIDSGNGSARLSIGPELGTRSGFASSAERVVNRGAVIDVVAEIMRQRSTAEWMSMLEEAGIPAGPINTVAQALNDPHVLAREMVVTLDHPTAGEISVTGNPAKFSATSEKHRRRHRCLESTPTRSYVHSAIPRAESPSCVHRQSSEEEALIHPLSSRWSRECGGRG